MTVCPENLAGVRFVELASTSVMINNSADFINLRIADDTDKGLIALVRLLAEIVYNYNKIII